jgi:hypothetical protein
MSSPALNPPGSKRPAESHAEMPATSSNRQYHENEHVAAAGTTTCETNSTLAAPVDTTSHTNAKIRRLVAVASSTNNTNSNSYDVMLEECEDLWLAAAEAQQLGRLKLSSSYSKLLHTRLIELGKRLDLAPRASIAEQAEQESQDKGAASTKRAAESKRQRAP